MNNPSCHPLLEFTPQIAQALAEAKPVVALESTIITHGMSMAQKY